MIIRSYFKCKTCDHSHTLRISVGHDNYQEHQFHCRGCGEPITVGMNVDYEKISAYPVAVSNCTESDEEGSVVNLSPLFVIPDELQGDGRAFPSILEMKRLLDAASDEAIEASINPTEDPISEWERRGRPAPGLTHDWEFCGRVWSLFLSGNHEVCANYIKRNYIHYRFDTPPYPFEVIYSICARIGRRRASTVYHSLTEQWELAKKRNPNALNSLDKYIVSEHLIHFLESSRTIFSEYILNISDFSQVLMYQDMDIPINEGYTPSSISFDRTKMYYGNSFELLTELFILPATINNILNGRNYDTFERLTLEQYLEIDKSGRHNSFQSNDSLKFLSDDLNNQIRNASHHGNMTLNRQSGFIKYKTRRSSGTQYIKYLDYLMYCNTTTQTIAGIIAFMMATLDLDKFDIPDSRT